MQNLDSPIKLLLVEESPADRELATAELVQLPSPPGPVEVVTAGDWNEAAPILDSAPFDLVLLAYNLPGRTGLEILPDLVARRIPVIMLTGQHDLGIVMRTIRAGAYDYVAKSADSGMALCLAVERVLERVALERALADSQTRLAARAEDLEEEVRACTVTVQAQAAAIEALYLESEEAARVKSEIVANLSHELRTPLSTILGYLDLLQDEIPGDVDATAHDMLLKTEAQARRLHAVLESLLVLGELRSGRSGITDSRFTVSALVNELHIEAEILNAHRGPTIHWSESSPLGEVENDREKIRTIAYHLLSNAIKFTREGRIDIAVETMLNGGVRIAVSDTGVGLPPEARAVIFEDFRQLDGSTTRSFEGLGLGLGIVKRYTGLLSGSLHLDSAPGGGTRVVIELPPPWARASPPATAPAVRLVV